MNPIAVVFFLVLIVAYAGSALWRVIQARRAVSRAGVTGPEAVGVSVPEAPAVPVSRVGLFVGIIAAVTVFVMQWLLISMPVWALIVWVPAALAVVVAAFEAARIGPQLPWLRPGHRRSDIGSAVTELTFTLLVIAAVVASVALAQR